MPIGPAIWVMARIKGELKPVCVQVLERMIITYNPTNDQQNRVQVSLAGSTIYNGLGGQPSTPGILPTGIEYEVWEDHTPGPGADKPPLHTDLVLQFNDSVDACDFDNPDNKLAIRRPSGELIVTFTPELLGVTSQPGAADQTRVEFIKPGVDPSPVKLTCGEPLSGVLELRLKNGGVVAIPLPDTELGCPV